MSMLRNSKGFTLVELMVVVIIVLVLAGIAVPVYIHYIQEGKKSEGYAVIDSIVSGALVYFQKHNSYTGGTVANWLAADDVGNAVYFTYVISGQGDAGFIVTATPIAGQGLDSNGRIIWTHDGADGDAGSAGSGEFSETGW
ncbi:prepilin-type N-terminal cleavage/methylation domain-containing protein [bacterium]|nr:prepilin-type N-terminal cleavage/methylation domain-containing protein [bacterium]